MDAAIECFIVRVRKKHKTDRMPLENFDGAGADLTGSFKNALQPLVDGNYKKIIGKSISLVDLNTSTTGFTCSITVAEYGYESEVIDVTNGQKVYDKKKTHGDKIPYFMRLHVPVGGDQAIMMLLRLGTGGINSLIKDIVREYFLSKYKNLTLDIRPMVPDFVMTKYLNHGTPKSVSFIKHSIPADYADVMSGKKVEHKGSVEVIIKSPVSALFQASKVPKAITTVDGIKNLYSFDDFEPDKVKMTIDIGGKIRTINLTNNAGLRSSFNITDAVSTVGSGYPTFASVSSAADEILTDIAAAAGIKL